MNSRSEDSSMAKNRPSTLVRITKHGQRQKIQIDVLPDDILLGVFDFHVDVEPTYEEMDCWQTLVHVCRRWRTLVFDSPRRLDLKLYCRTSAPAKDKLDIWPALPLVVSGEVRSSTSTDNVIAVLEQSNRVRQVNLFNIDIRGGQFEKLLAMMQVPFPELTQMRLLSHEKTLPLIPDSFLGGSAPSLRSFALNGIPFPGLPNLLLSAAHLVTLLLDDIPHSGYFSPEAIGILLSVLPNLILLRLDFRSPQSCPDWRSQSLPPQKRSTIPLRRLCFKGVTEYLEELLARINTPRLEYMQITFFNQIDFDCPRLAQFINCASTFRTFDEAHVEFGYISARVIFRYPTSSQHDLDDLELEIGISCRELDWQLSFIEQICNSCLPSPSTIHDLYIEGEPLRSVWKTETHAIENTLWLQLLLPFSMVKNLYLATVFVPGIAAALQELAGGRNTEVLPSLENIFVRVPNASTFLHKDGLEASTALREDIGQFLAARQLSGHPIVISVWK